MPIPNVPNSFPKLQASAPKDSQPSQESRPVDVFILPWTVGVQTCVRPMHTLISTRAVVAEAVEPRRLPLKVVRIDAVVVVTQMRSHPCSILLIVRSSIPTSFLLDQAQLLGVGRRLDIGDELAGFEEGDVVDGVAFWSISANLSELLQVGFVHHRASIGVSIDLDAAIWLPCLAADLADKVGFGSSKARILSQHIEPPHLGASTNVDPAFLAFLSCFSFLIMLPQAHSIGGGGGGFGWRIARSSGSSGGRGDIGIEFSEDATAFGR